MNIIAFNGSPRAEQSTTHIMVAAFLAGAEEAGAKTEQIYLAHKKIGYCLGCFSCWLKTPGKCIQSDDMADLIQKYLSSDVAIFASPLYMDNVSGIMKNFMDRLLPVGDPHFEKDNHGDVRHIKGKANNPKFIMISNCGFPEQSNFQVLKLLAKRLARNYQTEFITEIYLGAGGMLQVEEMKPLADEYTKLLKTAGAEVVKTGTLSSETSSMLDKPLIKDPGFVDTFIANMNEYMDSMIAANKPI
ncbi:flavodoxin family protein [Methanospirillum sp.]